MGYIAVHVRPVPVLLGLRPGINHELQAAVQKPLRICIHAVNASDAKFVMFRSGTCHPAQDAVGAGVEVRGPEDCGSGAGTESQRCKLLHETLPRSAGLIQPAESGFLGCLCVLAVHDHRVLNLTGFDHVRCEGHAVDESEAGVSHIEVHGGGREAKAIVNLHSDRWFEVGSRDGRVDQQSDLRGFDSRGREGLRARFDGAVLEPRPGRPPAPLGYSGDALKETLGEPQALQRR